MFGDIMKDLFVLVLVLVLSCLVSGAVLIFQCEIWDTK